MALELVTGYRGRLHITAPQDADLYRGLIGDCIVKVGSEMAVEITSPTEITISDGVCLFDGREFFIGYGETASAIATVDDGEAYLCICYEKDEANEYETADFQILESYDDQDIRENPSTSQKPFARLMVENGEITEAEVLVPVVDPIKTTSETVEAILKEVQETLERLQEDVSNLEELIETADSAVSDARSAASNASEQADRANEAAEKAEEAAETLERYDERLVSVENRVTVLESYHTGDPIAFAIFCEDDGSMTFYQDTYLPTGTYKDKAITEIYTTLETGGSFLSLPAWFYISSQILNVVFDASFLNVQLTYLTNMFNYCKNLISIDFSGLDTSKASYTNYMFYGCESLTELDLTNFETANVERFEWMFADCTNLKTIYANDDKFDISSAINSNSMFYNCTSLVGGNGTTYDDSKTDASMAHVDTASNPGYFTAKED